MDNCQFPQPESFLITMEQKYIMRTLDKESLSYFYIHSMGQLTNGKHTLRITQKYLE